MIVKLKKGSSFAGCIRYVTGKDEAKILASDGVLLGTNAEMTQSFELQRQLNPRIKKPVGHIALSFKPEDKPRLTDEFMAKIALEYMQMMGITDTQFIIVRHHNTDNPHCHIVYNRINNEGKLISDRNDYRRNEQVTKALKSKYGLTYGTDKSKTNTRKLRNAERAKYEIHNAVKDALKVADNWQKFKNELAKRGVRLELVYKDKEQTKVQGIRFCKDGYSFKGTQISRDYSFGKLNARFEGTENHVSARAISTQQYEQGSFKDELLSFMSESSQNPWNGISSIGLFAPANAQTFESFPEDESAKKKKKKRRKRLLPLMQVTNHSNNKRKMKEELLEAIYGTVERLEQKVDELSASPKNAEAGSIPVPVSVDTCKLEKAILSIAVKEGESIDKLARLREAICYLYRPYQERTQAKMSSEANSCLIPLIR